MDASNVKPPHQKLAEPPYRLGPTFTRTLSLWNPLDYLRILYWVFFHPQWISDYVKWLAPDYPDRPRPNETLTLLKNNAHVRSFFAQSLLSTIIISFGILFFVKPIGASITYLQMAISVLIIVLFEVVFGVVSGVTSGLMLGTVFGILLLPMRGEASHYGNIRWVTIGAFFIILWVYGVRIGFMESNFTRRRINAIPSFTPIFSGIIIGITRWPVYIFALVIVGFRKKNHPNPAVKLDGLISLPIPGVRKELIETLKESPASGMALCAEYLNYSLQLSSIKQAVYYAIDNDQNRIHFWCRLLSQYKLFLFFNLRKDLPTDNPWNHICPNYRLLISATRPKIDSIIEIIHKIDELIANFNIESHLRHSYEVIHSYALLRDCLGCENVGHIAALATRPNTPLNELENGGGNFNWLDTLPEPELRPELLYVLRELRTVALETGILTEQTSRAGRLAATARASDTLRALIEYASLECFEPEKTILNLIIKLWADIITKAGGEVGRSALPIDKIPNNYIVGPALRGQKGRLFVGRDDIYHEVTRLWSNEQVKQTVVFYGQRRMGKTSILLHMESNLDAQYLPVFLDMQTLATVTSHGAFLYNLADSVSHQLNKTGLSLPIPSLDHYNVEPFIAFRKYIEAAEEAIPPDNWAVLMIDEFELVEEKLKAGVFPSDLMLQFRNIMQHHPRFVLVFAGSHHLDELRQDYWSPLLNIARVIKVGYLSYTASYELITNPWDDFSLEYREEVVEIIIKAACGQPLLTQDICSKILERVNERLARGGPEMAPTATLEDAQAGIENILDTSEYFRAVYSALPPDAQNLLKTIALKQKDADEGVRFAEIEIDLPGKEKSDAMETLKRRDMIVETGDKVRITVELVRRWLLR